MSFERKQILSLLQAQIKIHGHITGVAAGTGLLAKYAAKGGVDLILALNSGHFRHMGVSSLAGLLPFANSNQLVMEFGARQIVPMVPNVPVIFGLCATDPTIDVEQYLDAIRRSGFSGVNNYPTVGMFDGQFSEALAEEGITFAAEVEAIRLARQKNLFSIAFVFTPEQAQTMAAAGADMVCAHLGLTKGGLLGAKKVLSLKAGATIAQEIFQACDQVRHDVIKVIFGGSVHTPIDVKYMYQNTAATGYLGGSAFERIPLESSIIHTIEDFKLSKQDEMLHQMLDNIASHYDYVSFVKQYINNNYMHQISLNDLALVAHVSRTYLSALFKKEVGISFRDYLIGFRLNKAAEILRQGNLSIAQAAKLAGYSDYAHFSKSFKKYSGLSPTEFVQSYKNT